MILSAFLTLLISPLGTALAAGLAGLLLALFGRRRLACTAGVFAIGWIACWSLPPVADWITAVASGPYRAAAGQDLASVRQLPRAEAIVLLGGGIAPANAARALPDLNEASDRVWQAARLFQAGRAPLILASGGHDPQASRYSEAQAMRLLLLDLGVPAEAILLGCAGLGPIDKAMEAELGVPVLDGTACAVTLAESLCAYGLTTSRAKAFMRPEPKELVACPAPLIAAYVRREEEERA